MAIATKPIQQVIDEMKEIELRAENFCHHVGEVVDHPIAAE